MFKNLLFNRLCRYQWPRGIKLACWDCGFESRRMHGRLSLVIVVY